MNARLIRGPLLISVALTLLRLFGELGHVSDRLFLRSQGGPAGVSWIFGITFLPVLFGPFFLDRLRASEGRPPSLRVLVCGILGAAFVLLADHFVLPRVPLPFPRILIAVWAVMAAGAALQAYGLASRAVVALVMLLAMIGNWGTHYDYFGMPAEFQMPLLHRFLWLALFPQFILWVGFTLILGSVAAGLYGLLTRSRETPERGVG
jgi:hypothetical protein